MVSENSKPLLFKTTCNFSNFNEDACSTNKDNFFIKKPMGDDPSKSCGCRTMTNDEKISYCLKNYYKNDPRVKKDMILIQNNTCILKYPPKCSPPNLLSVSQVIGKIGTIADKVPGEKVQLIWSYENKNPFNSQYGLGDPSQFIIIRKNNDTTKEIVLSDLEKNTSKFIITPFLYTYIDNSVRPNLTYTYSIIAKIKILVIQLSLKNLQ